MTKIERDLRLRSVQLVKPDLLVRAERRKLLLPMLLIAVVLAATFLRVFHLNAQSFSYDEAATLRIAADLSIRDIHPPLYYAFIHTLLTVFRSEFLLRLSSVITGVLGAMVVYQIGVEVVSPKAARIAMLLAAISPLLVWHSQDLRMYSLALLLSLLTVLFYLRILRYDTPQDWAGYGILALLAMYTHLYTLLIVFCLCLHTLIFHRRMLPRWIALHLVLALCYVPWIASMLSLKSQQVGTGRAVNIFTIGYTYFTYAAGYTLGPTINELRAQNLATLSPYLTLIVPIAITTLVLMAAGVRHLWRQNREKACLLLLLTFVPVVMATGITLVKPGITFNVRYTLFSLPAFLMILASGVDGLERRAGEILLAVFIMYNGFALYNHFFNVNYAREDVRGAVQYITEAAQPDDHIVVVTIGNIFKWYFGGDNLWLSSVTAEPFPSVVNRAADGANAVWLVESREWQSDPRGEIKSLLDSRYPLLDVTEFHGVSVFHYCVANCTTP